MLRQVSTRERSDNSKKIPTDFHGKEENNIRYSTPSLVGQNFLCRYITYNQLSLKFTLFNGVFCKGNILFTSFTLFLR